MWAAPQGAVQRQSYNRGRAITGYGMAFMLYTS